MYRRSAASLIVSFGLTAGLALAQSGFQDVQPGPDSPFFTVIQTAQRLGLAVPSSMGPCLGSAPGASQQTCPFFGPDAAITRAEAAYWIVRSQADESQITEYLCATGGDPSGLSAACNSGPAGSTFGDLGAGGAAIMDPFVGVSQAQLMRDIEVMARRGYSKGCASTSDGVRQFCPNDLIDRAQLAAMIIRAKMSNVFPTTLSGIPLTSPFGDNFSFPTTPFFTDVTPTDPDWGIYFPYVQKMRELGITHGTSATTFSPGLKVTRKEMAAFAVRAFFL